MSRTAPLAEWLQDAHILLPHRLWSKALIEGPDECWTWTAAIDRGGYGRIGLSQPGERAKRSGLAHRVAYELVNGPIPDGLHIDHLCRNRRCINPRHLEAVTQTENNHRSMSPTMISRRANRCFKGHELTPENTVLNARTGWRRCRTCLYAYQRNVYRQKRRAA